MRLNFAEGEFEFHRNRSSAFFSLVRRSPAAVRRVRKRLESLFVAFVPSSSRLDNRRRSDRPHRRLLLLPSAKLLQLPHDLLLRRVVQQIRRRRRIEVEFREIEPDFGEVRFVHRVLVLEREGSGERGGGGKGQADDAFSTASDPAPTACWAPPRGSSSLEFTANIGEKFAVLQLEGGFVAPPHSFIAAAERGERQGGSRLRALV